MPSGISTAVETAIDWEIPENKDTRPGFGFHQNEQGLTPHHAAFQDRDVISHK